ncbi:glycosyltransferase [Lactiplantibacillus paraplantarum]|uniref:glycosyltransferase n=1 Tax=Lactiplantibacillus paraplantarum TaxID=60520 RepID=UPI000E096797|nr:glycosyltransferase [Lactiplantibacillus paraplantarum]MCW1909844.1 glycosyltransferase [Lactiplantibacillus paraplantarum]RDG11218.1 poly(glycerol-phosphate) alpha-glucosyltransferase [Lactiplantibacillus paraplantarum]
MYYFVGTGLGLKLTGIEKAQLNRLALFEAAGYQAKCVYVTYNPRLHEHAARFGAQGKCFSLYDFFQGTMPGTVTKINHDWLHYWQKICQFQVIKVANTTDVGVLDANGQYLMYAHFVAADLQQLDYINYFDQHGVKIRREFYDNRGFLSRTSFLVKHQEVHTEVYYDLQGRVKLIKQYDITQPEPRLRLITLKNYQQRDFFFDSEQALQTFFFDELATADDIYFCDRNRQTAAALSKTRPAVRVCSVLHSTHLRIGADVVTGQLKSVYRYVLAHPDLFARIIVSTEHQKRDLLKRYDHLPPVDVIPVGFTTERPVKSDGRDPHRIISVARYSPEKQLLHQLEVVRRLVGEFPDITLHLFGHGQKIETQMRQFITTHHLERNIFIRGFLPDLAQEYQQASLALMTSVEEGFSLATMEAESYGVPVIGYQIAYGPEDIIEDGVNGYLVTPNDIDELTMKVRDYLQHPEQQAKFSANAYRSAERYNKQTIIKKWQHLLAAL